MNNKKISGFFAGKGYYIALVLCIAAIGICSWAVYWNADSDPQLSDPDQTAGGDLDEDLEALATDPTNRPPEPTAVGGGDTGAPDVLQTAWPVEGQTVATYAMDMLSYNQTTRDWRTHDGMDIAAEAGTQVCAAAAGTVLSVHEDDSMGMTVVISHIDGYTTEYSSLDREVFVSVGDTVRLGQAIGTVGQSALVETAHGDHVHFGVRLDGEYVDPVSFLSLGE